MLYKGFYIVPFRNHYMVVDGNGTRLADVDSIQEGKEEVDAYAK